MGITARTGAVLQISVNEATLVPYVVNTLRDSALAIQLASRLNLPGADDLYTSEFNRMLASNDVAGAARLAGESPNGEEGGGLKGKRAGGGGRGWVVPGVESEGERRGVFFLSCFMSGVYIWLLASRARFLRSTEVLPGL